MNSMSCTRPAHDEIARPGRSYNRRTSMRKNIVALARVSSREQKEEGYSLEVQEDAIREYAKHERASIHKLFSFAETASKPKFRSAFHEVVGYIKAHADEIDEFVVHKLNRASRNDSDGYLLHQLEVEYGVRTVSLKEKYDDTPNGRFMKRVSHAVGILDTETISDQVRGGLKKRVENGLFPSRAPYGYKNVRVHKRGLVEIDREKSQNVKRIFQLYAFEDVSGEDIPERLLREGRRCSPSKERFTISKIYAVLSDRSYIGEIKFRGDWHPGRHQPLIDRGTWDRTQSILGRKSYRSHGTVFGGGLINCGFCGRKIVAEPKIKQTKAGERRYVYYRCARYASTGHPRIRVREEELDLQIGLSICRMDVWFRAAVPDWLRQLSLARLNEGYDELKKRLSDLKRQHSGIPTQQEELLELRLAGAIDRETFVSKEEVLREREAVLSQQIDSLSKQMKSASSVNGDAAEIFGNIAARWTTADLIFKRRVLEIVFGSLTLEGTRLLIGNGTPFELFHAEH